MIPQNVRHVLVCMEELIKNSVLASTRARDLVYSYRETADGQFGYLTVFHNHLLSDCAEIDPGYDWYVRKKLWFRKNLVHGNGTVQGKDFYEAYVGYLPAHMPIITVDLDKPLAQLRIKLPLSHASLPFTKNLPQGVFA